MPDTAPRYFALVPAAGTGNRMASACPKQYLPLLERPLIHHTLAALCAQSAIERVFVVLAPDDAYWHTYDWSTLGAKLVPLFCGGDERAASVLAGLREIARDVAARDWVLVHDAARPCVAARDLERLMTDLADHEVGGLLGAPVADTLKRTDAAGRVLATVAREHVWHAQTPQMFRYALLCRALEQSGSVTDEAGAIEAAGLQPQLVMAASSNFKVTYPQDLLLAERILGARDQGAGA